MNNFYLSPSNLTYHHYTSIVSRVLAFGWSCTYLWPKEAFKLDYFLNGKTLIRSIRALSRSDIFISYIPGTFSSCIELGMAYTLCEEVFLASRDPIHFTQTCLADAHLAALPKIKRVCCDIEDIPILLEQEYLYMIDFRRRQQHY